MRWLALELLEGGVHASERWLVRRRGGRPGSDRSQVCGGAHPVHVERAGQAHDQVRGRRGELQLAEQVVLLLPLELTGLLLRWPCRHRFTSEWLS